MEIDFKDSPMREALSRNDKHKNMNRLFKPKSKCKYNE